MRKSFKKVIASVMAITTMAVSMVGITTNADTVIWNTPYGTATGESFTTLWSMSNSPLYRKVEAKTTVVNAVPYIYARIEAYHNGNLVLSNEATWQNTTMVYTEDMSTSYVNSTLHGNGTHAVWSSSLTRVNHYSYF